jgi:hypothetical protein
MFSDAKKDLFGTVISVSLKGLTDEMKNDIIL